EVGILQFLPFSRELRTRPFAFVGGQRVVLELERLDRRSRQRYSRARFCEIGLIVASPVSRPVEIEKCLRLRCEPCLDPEIATGTDRIPAFDRGHLRGV